MRKFVLSLLALTMPLALSACGNVVGPNVDINAVVDRTEKTLENFNAYLVRYDYKQVDKAMFDQFNSTYEHDLNAKPKFHPTAIKTVLHDNGSIMAYGDLNANGRVDAEEPKLFRLELDPDHNRIIITASNGVQSGRSMAGSGFFSGVMIGSLMSRQSKAGIKYGHFDTRNVAGAPATRRVASTGGSVARASARSGGLRGGK